MPESRVSISRPYRAALLRSPCWAGGDPGVHPALLHGPCWAGGGPGVRLGSPAQPLLGRGRSRGPFRHSRPIGVAKTAALCLPSFGEGHPAGKFVCLHTF